MENIFKFWSAMAQWPQVKTFLLGMDYETNVFSKGRGQLWDIFIPEKHQKTRDI